MIKLEVLNSNEPDRLGFFVFYKDLIYVGSNHDADLYIPLDEITLNHIFLEIVDSKLIVHLGRETEFILVNGKRTTSFKAVKIGDKITLNSLTFKIDSFNSDKRDSVSGLLKARVAEAKEKEPELMELLKTFGDEL